MSITTLKDLDFSPGIKAKDINENFNLIHDWITRERLRTAGWGLVEGFDMKASLEDFSVHVDSGIFINKSGEEVFVSEHNFLVGEMDTTFVKEKVYGNADGIISLTQRPYSSSKKGYIRYVPPKVGKYPLESEFYITDCLSGMRVPILEIVDTTLIIDATNWNGRELEITYYTTEDRIDSIMLYPDGSYGYQKGIISSSPSHVDLGDYENCFMIGVVYWSIAEESSVHLFDDHRTYRPVYVDKQDRLFLNGKLYKENIVIYLEEPVDPAPDTFWYDRETNILYVWRQDGDAYGWVPVNQFDYYNLREVKMFPIDYVPEENEKGQKTRYLFDEDETNLRFIPNTNALEIIIDNAPLMVDQYKEIIQPGAKDYLSAGIGFELLNELDHEAFIQVKVNHVVKAKPTKETFQRAAVFIEEDGIYYDSSHNINFIQTPIKYVVGQNQIEVWGNGHKLIPGIDFVEVLDDGSLATPADRGILSDHISILTPVLTGDYLDMKISRWVWSYDQLDMMMHEIEDKADDALSLCADLRTDLTNLNNNMVASFNTVNTSINNIRTDYGDPKQYMKTTDKLTNAQVQDDIKDKLVGDNFQEVFAATAPIMNIPGIKPTDFIIVNYISDTLNKTLIQGLEYDVILASDGLSSNINLNPAYIITGANVYISGFKKGAVLS